MIRNFLRCCLLAVTTTTQAAQPSLSDWHNEAGHRWAPLMARSTGLDSGFELVPHSVSGLAFTNQLSDLDGARNRTLYNGSGVATGDVDGDGWPDIFLPSLAGENRLYRNLGNGHFTNFTAAAGLGHPIPFTRGAVLADVNGDRSLDLLLTVNGGGVLCFTNDGHGHFTDATDAAGTRSRMGTTSLALADVDGNGTVDLYVVNYRNEDIRDRGRVSMTMVNGRPVLRGSETNRFVLLNGRLEETGQPDQLYLNDGHGHFTAVPWTGGAFRDTDGKPLAEAPLDWGLSAGFRDLNGDGAPDLYVCNDYWTVDRLWWNDGHGNFRAASFSELRKTSSSSMGVAFADIDRDGQTDFFVVDMLSRDPRARKRQRWAQKPMPVKSVEERPQVMRNTLFLNRGAGRFSEIAPFAGVSASDWSWSPLFLDVDLDGYEDLLIGAGHFRDVQDSDAEAKIGSLQRNWDGFPNEVERQKAFSTELMEHLRLYPRLDLPVVAYRNRGDTTFEEVTGAWGLDHPAIHHGMAVADFDGDGIRDLVVNVLNGPAQFYHGRSKGQAIAVRLHGRAPNTSGIGARLTLLGGAVPVQTTEMMAGGGYESGSDPEVVFAAGAPATEMTLRIDWRQGAHSEIRSVQAGRRYEIDEPEPGADTNRIASAPPMPAPWFKDVSARLDHRHQESDFNDFDQQPLLPYKLSDSGPSVAWVDLDGDGREDLLIGSALGQAPTALRNVSGAAAWTRWQLPAGATPQDDTTGIALWPKSGSTVFYWGMARYENRSAGGVQGIHWQNDAPQLAAPRPPLTNGVSVLALADLSGAGEWVLFAGAGPQPGAYPRGQANEILRWSGQAWQIDTRSRALLRNDGRTTGAIWTDLTGDGRPELVVAGEWGPIRVFQDRQGSLFEITADWGLSSFTGLWRGIAVGDFNGDGRMDLVGLNWGLNSAWAATPKWPLILAFGETSQPGMTDLFETEWIAGLLALRRPWTSISEVVPYIGERFNSVTAYSEASLATALGDRAVLTRQVQVTHLESMLFLNTGTRFEAQPLPRDAQLAPASAATVADLDGDGREDVFISQNVFSQPAEEPRIDAGRGLWLRGNGHGGFTTVPLVESGIEMLGAQRGCAVADFDLDGRTDLVVAQNGDTTRLWHNEQARPGLRVQLQGNLENPKGIGAQIRVHTAAGFGPARELHAGSGSGSQDSLIPVMTAAEPIVSLWIRWPGGTTTETPLSPNARHVIIDPTGKVVLSE